MKRTIEGNATKLVHKQSGTTQNINETIPAKEYYSRDSFYLYNGDGIRVKKHTFASDATETTPDAETVETQYFYFGSTLLFTADIHGYKLTENVIDPYGNTILSKRYIAGAGNELGYYAMNMDVRGSTTNVIRADGTSVTGFVYDEFGNQIKTGERDFIVDATYTGSIYDEETGLQYMNARYYDPGVGRFISKDSYRGDVFAPWTQHLYSYTGGNPINYTDPTGHISDELYHRNIDKAKEKNIAKKYEEKLKSSASKVILENREYIEKAAKKYNINPYILAAIIYTEQDINVNFRDTLTDWLAVFGVNTSIGVAQVRITTAIRMEELGYIDLKTDPYYDDGSGEQYYAIGLKLYYKLMDPETNITYSASYVRYQIDRWAKDYPDFKHSAGLLGTVYSIPEFPTHNNPRSNTEFGYPAKENYYFIKNVLWK